MNILSREQAIRQISTEKIKKLSPDDRYSYILNWWVIDENDIEFSSLSSALQKEILENEDAPENCVDSRYDELILIALSVEFRGVCNSFLEEVIVSLGASNIRVIGEVEDLKACPCCGYKTLSSRGEYEICRLCNWEDDGTDRSNKYSGPNRKTLEEGQREFRKSISGVPISKFRK